MKKQAHVYYSGRVQGIGFRYTLRDIADENKLTGWVKNLSDGRVELMIEAQEDQALEFLDKISQEFSRNIIEARVEWGPATGEFRDFEIKL